MTRVASSLRLGDPLGAGAGILCALASGLALWLASPAVGAGWLVWVALVPVAWFVLSGRGEARGRLWRRAAVPLTYAVFLWLLLVPAFPPGLADGQWGDPVLPVLIAGTPLWFVALVAVPLVGLLLFAARFGQPWGMRGMRAPLVAFGAIAVPAAAWTALDFLRVMVDPGALWGPLFLSQAGEAAGAMAALGGPWLLTFAIVCVNYGLALSIVRRAAMPALVPALAAALLAAAGGAAERSGEDQRRAVSVAALQPGYDTAERDQPALERFAPGTRDLAALDLIDELAGDTREAAGAGAEIVVWPQATMYVDPREHEEVRERLEELAVEAGASIVVPFFMPSPVREDYALAVEYSAEQGSARLTESRPKHRPLWFLGENRAEGESRPLGVGGVELGLLLGVDTLDPSIAAGLRDQGAELLVSATHDWRQSAVFHRAFSELTARATGAPLVRADWRYGSAVFAAPGGELAADAGAERRAELLVASVAVSEGRTPYAAIGNLLGWLALAGTALAAGWAALAARRRKRSR